MFNKIKSQGWFDVVMGGLLIAGTTYIVLNNFFYQLDPTQAHGYRNRSTWLIWDKFLEYGGRWVLLTLAIYYGVGAIRDGIKKYNESAK